MSHTISPSIVFEGKDFIIISKPPLMHSDDNKNSKNCSVAIWLESKGKLLNRLDYETSGILIASKNETFTEHFKAVSRLQKVKKTYLALVEGNFNKPIKEKTYIGSRSRGSNFVRIFNTPSKKYRTQPAYTEFYPHSHSKAKNSSYVKVVIYEGRRHQIRAHAASLGFPLVGDIKYGSRLKADHFILHAWKIEFPDPKSSEKMLSFEVPLPNKFSKKYHAIF